MSDSAKALLHYVHNAAAMVADNDGDLAYCLLCARGWAAYIITKATQPTGDAK